MTTANIIEGLLILDKYRTKPGGYNAGAAHDILYAYKTDNPLDEADVKKMNELGWFQEDAACDEWTPDDYDPDKGWTAYV